MLTFLKSVTFSHGEFEYIDDFLWTVDMKINLIAKNEDGEEIKIGHCLFTIINPNHPTYKDTLHVFPLLSRAIQSVHLYKNFEDFERKWLSIQKYIESEPNFKFAAYGKIAYLKQIHIEEGYQNRGLGKDSLYSIFSFLKEEMDTYFVLTDPYTNSCNDIIDEFYQKQNIVFFENVGFRKTGDHLIAAL